jgi:hypothetical protein
MLRKPQWKNHVIHLAVRGMLIIKQIQLSARFKGFKESYSSGLFANTEIKLAVYWPLIIIIIIIIIIIRTF